MTRLSLLLLLVATSTSQVRAEDCNANCLSSNPNFRTYTSCIKNECPNSLVTTDCSGGRCDCDCVAVDCIRCSGTSRCCQSCCESRCSDCSRVNCEQCVASSAASSCCTSCCSTQSSCVSGCRTQDCRRQCTQAPAPISRVPLQPPSPPQPPASPPSSSSVVHAPTVIMPNITLPNITIILNGAPININSNPQLTATQTCGQPQIISNGTQTAITNVGHNGSSPVAPCSSQPPIVYPYPPYPPPQSQIPLEPRIVYVNVPQPLPPQPPIIIPQPLPPQPPIIIPQAPPTTPVIIPQAAPPTPVIIPAPIASVQQQPICYPFSSFPFLQCPVIGQQQCVDCAAPVSQTFTPFVRCC